MAQEESPQSPSSDDFFNQPVQQDQASSDHTLAQNAPPNESIPRPKRIACILCRKRKLKCDGTKPSCGTCSRLGHNCEYNEERKKSGPKRGYVKLLEARLKQVENLLETRETPASDNAPTDPDRLTMPASQIPTDTPMHMNIDSAFTDPTLITGESAFGFNGGDDFSWEMIGLGLEEALPSQDVIDELNQIYFDKIHPSLPMIHKARFLSAMDLAPNMRPAICLRYIMWAHSASVTAKYQNSAEHFYARARKYAEQDEMRGLGESLITLAHCQAWNLIACYEFKMIAFPRAWMSIGRASSLALMMGLHRQDRVGLDVKQTLPPPRDWTDREERRRTFWMSYCQDRYASIGTGWPMRMDEQDILTNLPANESAFLTGRSEPTGQLSDILNGLGTETISSFSGVILLATLYGRNLTHLHRPGDNDNDHDLNGEFWKRHRQLDNILLNISLSMPSTLRLPGSLSDPNAIFCNMNIHTAAICLHQAAIFKADKHQLPAQISAESKRRCIVAADQVTNIMKMISHLDLSLMNPFLAFCLYVAARVFVQYLKSRREDQTVMSALTFLLSAMHVLKTKNPLTESFLVQLDVDLEGANLNVPSHSRYRFGHRPPGEVPANTDAVHCVPVYEVRESQSLGQTERGFCGPGTKDFTPPWPSDSTTSTDYPNLYGTDGQPDKRHEKLPHIGPAPDFSTGDDPLLYGNPKRSNNSNSSSGPSPNFSAGDNSSHSGQPTPSTTSLPYHESTPPNINPPSSFFIPSQTKFPQGGNGRTMNGFFDANPMHLHAQQNTFATGMPQSWNIESIQQNQSGSAGASNTAESTSSFQQQLPNQRQGNNKGAPTPGQSEFIFGGTGMTPGATGMTPLPESLWQHADGGDWMYGGWSNGN